MWMNALEKQKREEEPKAPARKVFKPVLKPEGRDAIRRYLFRLKMWIAEHWAWIVFWGVCIGSFVIVNALENLVRVRPSVGGEGALLIIPLITWLVCNDKKGE